MSSWYFPKSLGDTQQEGIILDCIRVNEVLESQHCFLNRDDSECFSTVTQEELNNQLKNKSILGVAALFSPYLFSFCLHHKLETTFRGKFSRKEN